MKRIKQMSLFAGLIILTACVTINIYFPSAEAREAAEKIVDDIMSEEKAQPATESDDQSMVTPQAEPEVGFNLLDFFVPSAYAAAQPKFDADTPLVRKLQASMKSRYASLKAFFENGAIGFTRDALVGIREISAVPLKQRGQLKNLVDAENKDRNALYREIAKANGHPEWEKDVRTTFGKTWIANSLKGWWYQNEQGAWVQK